MADPGETPQSESWQTVHVQHRIIIGKRAAV